MNRMHVFGVVVALGLMAQAQGRAFAAPMTSDVVFFGGAVIPLADGGPPGSQFLVLPPIPIPQPPGGPGVVLMFEDANMTRVSDQLGFRQGANGQPQWFFASDPDLQDVTGLPVVGRIVEDGTPQEVGVFFGIQPQIIGVQSDVVETPEPTSLMLLGLGIAGIAGYSWPRRK